MEKKILCLEIEDNKEFVFLPNPRDYKAPEDVYCVVIGGSKTRKEAIEVMAKALFEWQRPGCRGDVPIEDVWHNEQEGYEKLAEAALNALLEGVKK